MPEPTREPSTPLPRADAAALWLEHRGWLAAVLLAHMPREAELEDLMQDVAVAITRGLAERRAPTTAEALLPWMRAIARNIARTSLRRAYVTRRALPPRDAGTALAATDAEHADDVAQLRDLLESLPEHAREPLLLQSMHGLAVRDIAAVMDLPERTVETRLARARKRLREAMLDTMRARTPRV